MINIFEQSFYAGYFKHLPEHILCSALEQVYRDMRNQRVTCPSLFEEIFELKSALFLNSFFGASDLSYVDKDGKVVTVKSMNTSGAKAVVKRDTIDSSVSREYFKPDFIPGEDSTDFPLGYIKEKLKSLEDECASMSNVVMGYGANNPCGFDNCKPIETYYPPTNIRKCKGCR